MNINPRIVLATIVGLSMVGGALVFGQTNATSKDTKSVTSFEDASTRKFIPVTDNDKDGLPDWQNSFNISTIYMDDTPQATTTRTGELAIELATRTYLQGGDTTSLLTEIGTSLSREFIDEDYTKADIIIIEDNSQVALKTYGNRVAAITFNHAAPAGTEAELTILNRAFLRDDPAILSGLDPIITSYEDMIEAMLASPVPSSMTREHLALTNVYQAVLNDIKAFRGVFDDALPAMNRFRRYQADAEALYTAIVMLYGKLNEKGIEWNESDTASKLIEVD